MATFRPLRRLVTGLSALLRPSRAEDELDAELETYLESAIDDKMRGGLSREDAVRAARVELGSLDAVKERVRDVGWETRLEAIWRDVTYAARTLGRSRAFTAAVTLSLALGIGANTAVFTLADAVLWRPFPVSEPEHLLAVARRAGGTLDPGFTYAEFTQMREHARGTRLAAYASAPVGLSIGGSAEPLVAGHLVSGDYFGLLGVAPSIGRAIGRDDDRVPDGHPVVMLSHGYWERRFGGDAGIVGATIRVSGRPFTVVGVTPPSFSGLDIGDAPEVFLPLMMQPTVMPSFENLLADPIVRRTWVRVLARTATGTGTEEAAAAIDALLAPQAGPSGGGAKAPVARPRIELVPLDAVSTLGVQFSRPLAVVSAIVGTVLLIACANMANLLLARAASRRPELAMRLALGATRGRIVRQLVIESLLLASLGGVAGLLLARWCMQALLVFLSSGRAPIVVDVAPNLRVLLFTGAVSVSTAILVGLGPALRATRLDLAPALRNGRAAFGGRARPGRVLVVVQLALAVALVGATVVFAENLRRLNAADGDDVRREVLMLRVEPRGSDQRNVPGTAERLDRIYTALIERVAELPEVVSASMANATPTAPTSSAHVLVTAPSGDRVRVPSLMVYPAYFRTLGLQVVAGRDFTGADLVVEAPAVCVVNEAFVRRFLPGQDAIGRPCHQGRRPRLSSRAPSTDTAPADETFTIVGVVRDSRFSSPGGDVPPLIYRTFLQSDTGRGQMVLHARVAGNRTASARRIRELVASLDPMTPLFDVRTLEDEMHAALSRQRLLSVLSTCFGGLAILIGAIGLYGLLAFSVVQRRGELGMRLALGARASGLVWLVVRDALRLVAAGAALGLGLTMGLMRLAQARIPDLLAGVEPSDPRALLAATLTVLSVALAAAVLPARRASRVDPLVAMRNE